MSGGLANRMFKYSYAIYLNSKGVPACIDNKYKPTKWKKLIGIGISSGYAG